MPNNLKNQQYITRSLPGWHRTVASRANTLLLKSKEKPLYNSYTQAFISHIDALIMGRVTFETVLGFGVGWPYPVPATVLSSKQLAVPEEFVDHIMPFNGTPAETLAFAPAKG
jgi:dihydrofolate reductase